MALKATIQLIHLITKTSNKSSNILDLTHDIGFVGVQMLRHYFRDQCKIVIMSSDMQIEYIAIQTQVSCFATKLQDNLLDRSIILFHF